MPVDMLIQYVFEIVYLILIAIIILLIGEFYVLTRRPPKQAARLESTDSNANPHEVMEKPERNWLYFLLAVVLIGNLVTLGPLIPSASYGLWPQTPVETITIEVANYHFIMPQQPIVLHVGKVVRFIVVSHDVTYGFGVFRKDSTMVFQMQVLPAPYQNTITWVFDQPGMYDVRSTEYSGPQNPMMFLQDAIQVEG